MSRNSVIPAKRESSVVGMRGTFFRTAFALLLVATAAVAATAQQPARWRLVEEWRVGGAPTGAHSFLSVREIELLSNGGFLVLEYQDQQLHFLDSRGAPDRTVGRKGAGPGEFQQSNGFAVSPSGEIVVHDPANSRFTLLAANGDMIRTIPITPELYGGTWDGRFNSTGRLEENVRLPATASAAVRSARRVWSVDFARADTLPLPACAPVSPPLSRLETSFALTTPTMSLGLTIQFLRPSTPVLNTLDGGTWSGVGPDYKKIVRRDQESCADKTTIELRGPRLPVPPAERAAAMENVRKEALRIGSPVPDVERMPRQLPYYENLRQDRAGQLWVERNTAAGGRIIEVFSPAGVLLAEVESAIRLEAASRTIITNDRVFTFTKDADGLFFLVALRIQR